MLELRNIVKIYQGGTVNETCLFNDFNLTIPDGQFVSVIGSNGSGKTSLLNIICGSIDMDEGSVLVGGKNITEIEVPAAESFTGYGFTKGYVVMYPRPAQENWTINNLQNPRATFGTSEKVAFACQTISALKDSDDTVTTLLVVRDVNGSVKDYYTGEETWNNMWTRDTYVGELLRTPQTPGAYTLELYFNGKRVKTDLDIGFTITE